MDTIYNTEGCFYRALEDEPVFVLLARDPCAAETVRWWVTLRQALIGRGEKPLEDHETLASAMKDAASMVAWRSEATDPSIHGQTPRWKSESVPERKLISRVEYDALIAEHDATVAEMSARIAELEETISSGQNRPGWPPSAFLLRRAIELGTEGEADALVTKHLRDMPDDKLVTLHASTIREALAAAMRNREKAKSLAISLSADTSGVREALRTVADQIDALIRGDDLGIPYDDWQRLKQRMEPFVKDIRDQVEKVMPLPFIAVDLAAKMSVGLSQMADEYVAVVNSTTWPTTRKNQMLGFADRMRGYARELADGRMTGERLRSRTVGKSPLLGEPYTPSVEAAEPSEDPYKAFARIVGYDASRDSPAAILEAIGKTLGISYEDMAADYRRVHGIPDPEPVPPGVYYGIDGGNFYDLVTNKGMGNDFYAKWRDRTAEFPTKVHDEFSVPAGYPHDWLGIREVMGTPPHFGAGETYDPARYRKGHADPAPTDMVDVTDTPELPPHRFTLFEKGREWAYGRGLEINPSHIPAMLDRMEGDGWHLQCVFGGIEPTKVGMLFYRRQPSAFEIAHGYGDWPDAPLPAKADDKPLSWPQQHFLGTLGPWPVWVGKDMPEGERACLRDAIAASPCGAGGRGRGQEP